MSNEFEKQLQSLFSERLLQQEPLSVHTNFRIGGPARWFVQTKTVKEIFQALDAAKAHGVPVFVLGGGSNVLVSDKGFDGLVIHLANRDYQIQGTSVKADAGVPSSFLARKTAEAGLAGLEWAATLPGTIGGAVRGNAGCFGGEMKDSVKEITVYRDGNFILLSKEDLGFHYRHSIIKDSEDVILSVVLELHVGEKEMLLQKMQEIVEKRKATQPTYAGSAGCLFKNYEIQPGDDFTRLKQEFDVPESMFERGQISVGWFIDQMGLKGTTIGDAQISKEHANFVINLGKANANDIVQIIALIKTQARDRFGIYLQEEVQYVGM